LYVLATCTSLGLDKAAFESYTAWQMYPKLTKVTKAGSCYQYLQLVESYRDEEGLARQRLVLNLGRVDADTRGDLVRLGRGLLRLLGEEMVTGEDLQAEETRLYGPLLVGDRLWEELGLGEKLGRRLRRLGKRDGGTVQAVLAMVLNRLVAPRSKLGVTRWLERVYLPELEGSRLGVERFYRALEGLGEVAEGLEEDLFHERRDLFEPGLEMVFYDVTSTYFEGEGPEEAGWGYSRDGRSDQPQLMVGLLVNREGLPLAHKVFPGNRLDAATVPEVLEDLRQRFGVRRVVFVGDRGMVSRENVEALGQAGYQYILGLRKRAGRRCWEALRQVGEEDWQQVAEGLRVARVLAGEGASIILCHSQARQVEEEEILQSKLQRGQEALERVAQGRQRGPQALRRAAEELKQAKASKYFELGLEGDGRLGFAQREAVVAREREMLGLYFLQTDVEELSEEEVVRAYMQLQEVEAAFRELKDFLKLRPIYPYRQQRVEAHVFVCVLAYLLEKLLALKLRAAGVELSARRALEELERIEVVRLRAGEEELRLISRPTAQGRAVLQAVGVAHLPRTVDAGAER